MNVLMPESANLLKWHKQEGDRIRRGDLLLEIETDKTVVEVEAEHDGVLHKILVAEDTNAVPAQQPIAVLLTQQEAAAAPEVHTGAQLEPVGAPPVPTQASRQGHIFASPLARRLAREHGLTLASISGTGPGGRVVERDVKRATGLASDAMPAASPTFTDLVTERASEAVVERPARPLAHEEIPLTGMRSAIAARVQNAVQTVPHFYLRCQVELDALVSLRASILSDSGMKLSLNDFFIKALALSLHRVPEANLSWGGDRLLKPAGCDVAVVIAVEDGLYTPVIRGAERLNVSEISQQVRELGGLALERRLSSQACAGGTSAVSNLGMHGVQEFSAIVNPPQSSVLAIGGKEQRIVAKSGIATAVNALTATLSCDHRVIDGATGARLLGAFRELVEKPMGLLV